MSLPATTKRTYYADWTPLPGRPVVCRRAHCGEEATGGPGVDGEYCVEHAMENRARRTFLDDGSHRGIRGRLLARRPA